jgi:signal transduction histidine kinase/CheY-like chemotaxis protein
VERGRVIEELAGIVLQHVQTAAIAVDDDGRVGVYNAAAARVLCVPVEDVVGRDLGSLVASPPALAALAAILGEARRSGRAATRRQVVVSTSSGERTLGYTLSVLGEGGAAALFFADLTDAVAEERRAAEAQRFAEVGRIASAMAHELKTPLATVELYANLLRRRLASHETELEQLDVIKGQTHLCLERIQAILHSINPDAARATGMSLTPVAPLARAVVSLQRRRNKGARLSLRVSANGARVGLGENDLRSVVSNLVTNALEVTAGKGPVDVRVDEDGEMIRLRVADRGPGLPDSDVFAAFFTTKSSGTGLGLWLVRRLVEDAGGSICARARRGGGAVFEVELPLPRHDRLRGVDLLVVEDDETLRTATTAALEARGASVTAVGAGKEVPQRSHAWECAILDYHLPDMTGVEIAARLPAGTPILMVSGDPAAGAALAEVHERRAWYLPKPFEVETYLDLVSLLVGSA